MIFHRRPCPQCRLLAEQLRAARDEREQLLDRIMYLAGHHEYAPPPPPVVVERVSEDGPELWSELEESLA